MTVWRPPASIRVKVLGLLVQGNRIFAADVPSDRRTVVGVRPLGGTIEFGETREAALEREFREELNAQIEILGAWTVFENIFRHEGHVGHEIVFAAPIRLTDRRIAPGEDVVFLEADGSPGRARWHSIDDLANGSPMLYPIGLRDVLRSIRTSPAD